MDPLLMEIDTQLETERLLLRMPRPGDGTVVNKAIKSSVAELKPWLGFVQELPTVEETELNTREAHIKFLKRESLRYLIFLKETNEFVGSTGFHNIHWSIPKLEIGYWIDTSYSGNGYMTEAVGKLTDFALDQLRCRRIEIRCDRENDRSRAVPERLGFSLEGILKNEDLSIDGSKITDTCVYAKV
ncbi:acetyltransferase [Alkalihalobacillus macyae]|uniref:Acetyltransferase n=2 Tax=Guptibacillus hwajinpoensis TaxID=208199 RepID=A0A0J6CXV3_9BACL|nr:GNAT family N-acetyltransferase [Alkalihalobacillus macyae]KMM38005.1 acetyltransferase [Alkalihalobacillus macyae]